MTSWPTRTDSNPQACGREIRCSYAHDSQIRIGIVTDLIRVMLLSVRQDNLDCACSVHNVAVRQYETVRCKNEAGARSAMTALLLDLNLYYRRTHLFRRRYNGFGIRI